MMGNQQPVEDKLKIRGILYGLAGMLSYSFTGPLVKMAYRIEPNISPYEILYWNSMLMMFLNYGMSRFVFEVFAFDVPKKYHRLILLRGFAGFISILGVYASVKIMPLSIATCFSYTLPLFTTIIAWLTIGEKL